jgi:hypothetical protein
MKSPAFAVAAYSPLAPQAHFAGARQNVRNCLLLAVMRNARARSRRDLEQATPHLRFDAELRRDCGQPLGTWRPFNASSIGMEDRCGQKERWIMVPVCVYSCADKTRQGSRLTIALDPAISKTGRVRVHSGNARQLCPQIIAGLEERGA